MPSEPANKKGLPAFDPDIFPFPEKNTSIADQWDKTYRLITGAQDHGVLDAPAVRLSPGLRPGQPTTDIEPIPEVDSMNPVRFTVLAEQLWLLGYLENKPGPNLTGDIQASATFKNAVKRFQQEAGLTVDGWTGARTWKAIKALVNFESKTHINLWKRPDNIFYRAFRRAVQLRLWTYGLAKKKPGPEFNAIPKANIEQFKKVLWSLSLIDDYKQKMSRTQLFSILFDPDLMVKAAANFTPRRKGIVRHEDSFADAIHSQEKHSGILQIKRRFLVNLAKVELWLIGSDIKIDGEDDFHVQGLTKKQLWGGTDDALKACLDEYWTTLPGIEKKIASKKTEAITPSLFKSFIEPDIANQSSHIPFSEKDYSRKIAEDFEKEPNTEELINKSYLEGKELGMRLWDGLKRLWAWIKKGVKKIVSFGKNLFRAFYRFAMKGFKIVKTAFTVFSKAMDQYMSGRIELNRQTPIVITLEKDMDYQTIAHDSASPSDLYHATRSVRRFGVMFLFSCKIIGIFIDVIKSAATGLLGWTRLLMVLVKAYRSLVPAYRELADIL